MLCIPPLPAAECNVKSFAQLASRFTHGTLYSTPGKCMHNLTCFLALICAFLSKEVVDITPTLRTLLGYADGTHLCNTLRSRRPLLTRAWLESMGVCGRRSNTSKLDLTEAAVAAPVTEFVSGCGCRLKPGQYQVRCRAGVGVRPAVGLHFGECTGGGPGSCVSSSVAPGGGGPLSNTSNVDLTEAAFVVPATKLCVGLRLPPQGSGERLQRG